jgi:titin
VTNYKITVTRANAVPNAPTLVSVRAGAGRATVSFSTTLAGGLATSFIASCTAAGHTPRTGSGTISPITVTQLTGGVVYSCSVTASNGLGTSASSASMSVTPRTDLTPILMLLLD